MITLDLNHFGFRRRGGQRGGEEEKKEAKGKVKGGYAPGPTSMVVSWIAKTPRALTRVVIRRGFQARANLNGGELDKEPSLHNDGQ